MGRQGHPSFAVNGDVVSASANGYTEGHTRSNKAERIGVRIRPNGAYGGMGSEDNPEMFTYLLEKLGRSPVGYVAILDGQEWGATGKCRLMTVFNVKQAYKGTVLATACYTRDIAEGAIRSGAADFVGLGRMYMSNPDLVERFLNDWPLNPKLDRKYWWDASMGTEGYTSFSAYMS
uniref:NADH:flavin oxidoreductase/NADH oxidase N-terminal domain-containing protein n=1 Tax=Globisporangium ultimum (strain ATCC 200006 / CBS 805.95 / DAOM BR144) TaxID=431595 RepID=K3WR14_GLOUD